MLALLFSRTLMTDKYFIICDRVIPELGQSYSWVYDSHQNNYIAIGYEWHLTQEDVITHLALVDIDVTLFTDLSNPNEVLGLTLDKNSGIFTGNTCIGECDATEEFMIMNALIDRVNQRTDRYHVIHQEMTVSI